MRTPARAWYDRACSRAVDLVLSDRLVGAWRRQTTENAVGVVLELGFGSGRNLDFYPAGVTEVWAVDPSDAGWERAQSRIDRFGRPVRRVGTDAARIAAPDASVDTVVSTWTLCSIPELPAALGEARRVLKSEGSFWFTEHSLAQDAAVAATQRRIQPAWGRVAGGCHVDRDLPAELTAAGWRLERLRQQYVVSLWPARPWAWFVSGSAATS